MNYNEGWYNKGMKTKFINRHIGTTVKKYADIFPAVALLGARQVGKTTLLKNLFKKGYNYICLDDLEQRDYADADPKGFLEDAGNRAIIDEIQYVPKLFSYVKMKIDKDPSVMGRYIFTGSQNFLLMKEFTETLAGRIGVVNIHPLSCFEIPLKTEKPSELFEKAALRGGYPVLWKNKKLPVEPWYKSYVKVYIERDVRNLFNIGSLRSFHVFVRILASRAGQLLNLTSLAVDSGVSVNTIKSWISVLESSGLIYLLHPYHKNIRSKLVKSPKVYFLDTGIISFFNGIDSPARMVKSGQKGILFENFVISEIIKKSDNSGAEIELSFFRNHSGLEVDIIIENEGRRTAAEIKSGIGAGRDSAGKMLRMEKEHPAMKMDKKYVVTFGQGSIPVARNVKCVSFVEFLNKVI